MPDITIGHWTKLGSAVRDARARHGWSQHELAERAGVSRSWLARLESGHRGAEFEQILRLLDALHLTLTLRDESATSDKGRSLAKTYGQLAAARRATWSDGESGDAHD